MAQQQAEKAVILVQGSLILSQGLNDVIAFFTLVRYQLVLLTKGLSPFSIPHLNENCYKFFKRIVGNLPKELYSKRLRNGLLRKD